jgi:RecJ-like exonuclease
MITCNKCNGKCCKRLAVQLDNPVTLDDYEDIFWYLFHRDAWVYIDTENRWWIQFPIPCSKLDKKGKCMVYEKRPSVCRKSKVEECDANVDDIKILFKDEEDYKPYFEQIKRTLTDYEKRKRYG